MKCYKRKSLFRRRLQYLPFLLLLGSTPDPAASLIRETTDLSKALAASLRVLSDALYRGETGLKWSVDPVDPFLEVTTT